MAHCRNPSRRYKGFKVIYEKLPKEYGGLNCYAARDLKLPYFHPCSTVVIDPKQTCKVIRETIKHEIIEATIMKKSKLPYKKAHKITETLERKLK